MISYKQFILLYFIFYLNLNMKNRERKNFAISDLSPLENYEYSLTIWVPRVIAKIQSQSAKRRDRENKQSLVFIYFYYTKNCYKDYGSRSLNLIKISANSNANDWDCHKIRAHIYWTNTFRHRMQLRCAALRWLYETF